MSGQGKGVVFISLEGKTEEGLYFFPLLRDNRMQREFEAPPERGIGSGGKDYVQSVFGAR